MATENNDLKHVKDGHGFILHGWMVSKLKLKGNELLCYMIIHGFTQSDGHIFFAGHKYIAEWLSITRQGATKLLSELEKKGYIAKVTQDINGVTRTGYVATETGNTRLQKATYVAGRQPTLHINNIVHTNVYTEVESKDDNIDKGYIKNIKDIVSTNDIVKKDIDISKPKDKIKKFIPPTVEEVEAYCKERENGVDAEQFVDFYSAKDWFIGKNKMKDWKAAVRTWEKRDGNKKKPVDRITELDDIF